MEQHDNVGPAPKCFDVAGLVVSAVAEIPDVYVNIDPEPSRQFGRVVGTGVIDQDKPVGYAPGDVGDRPLERRRRSVCRHHDDHLRHDRSFGRRCARAQPQSGSHVR
jgi:hypothetical protein